MYVLSIICGYLTILSIISAIIAQFLAQCKNQLRGHIYASSWAENAEFKECVINRFVRLIQNLRHKQPFGDPTNGGSPCNPKDCDRLKSATSVSQAMKYQKIG